MWIDQQKLFPLLNIPDCLEEYQILKLNQLQNQFLSIYLQLL